MIRDSEDIPGLQGEFRGHWRPMPLSRPVSSKVRRWPCCASISVAAEALSSFLRREDYLGCFGVKFDAELN